MRDGNAGLFIHNENGILWWAETLGNWEDLGLRDESKNLDLGHPQFSRYVAKKSLDGWQNKDKHGNLLKLSELHPILETISQTQATMQPIADLRGEYVQALINGNSLEPWEKLEEWKEAALKGVRHNANKSPALGIDELISNPTDFTGSRSNQVEGYVYVIGLNAYPGIYKIGHANDVESRIKTLQIGVPEEPIIHYELEFKNSRWAENEVHKLLHHKKVRGEWFKYDLKQIKRYVDLVKKQEP